MVYAKKPSHATVPLKGPNHEIFLIECFYPNQASMGRGLRTSPKNFKIKGWGFIFYFLSANFFLRTLLVC